MLAWSPNKKSAVSFTSAIDQKPLWHKLERRKPLTSFEEANKTKTYNRVFGHAHLIFDDQGKLLWQLGDIFPKQKRSHTSSIQQQQKPRTHFFPATFKPRGNSWSRGNIKVGLRGQGLNTLLRIIFFLHIWIKAWQQLNYMTVTCFL